jgi:hypothetical protein
MGSASRDNVLVLALAIIERGGPRTLAHNAQGSGRYGFIGTVLPALRDRRAFRFECGARSQENAAEASAICPLECVGTFGEKRSREL